MKWTLAMLMGLALAGCKREAPPQPPAPESTARTAGQAAPAVPELSDEDLAVPEDFMEEATTEVTPQNYVQKLAELEQEVGAEGE